MYSYEELLNVIAQLRSEHGCPWDKAQTHESLIPCLRNECEEVVQAIEQHDEENLCEELGNEEYGSPEQNQARWEEIKRQEKEAKKRRKLAENQGNLLDKQ